MPSQKTLDIIASMTAFNDAVNAGNHDLALEIDAVQTKLIESLSETEQYDLSITFMTCFFDLPEDEILKNMSAEIGHEATTAEKLTWLHAQIETLTDLTGEEKANLKAEAKARNAVMEGRLQNGPKGLQ